jgi:flagellar motor switch protein FliM
MTQTSGQDLSKAKVRRLLAAVGSLRADEIMTPEAAEYDWHDPHYFDQDQCNRLAAVMSQVAVSISEKFTHFYNREFSVTPTAITQHFAGDVRELVAFDQSWSLTFSKNKGDACGFLTVSEETALKWVTRLLGDAEESEPNRVLSSLEESLLDDLTSAMLEAFVSPLSARQELHPEEHVVRGQPSIQFDLTEEICQITFEIKDVNLDQFDQARFVLPGRVLAPLVGKKTQKDTPVSGEELSRMLMEHVYRMPVTVTATLCSTILGFAEIVDLRPDDVLLLGRTVDEPIELVIDERVVFRGRPARSDGHYAVFLTDSAGEAGAKEAAPTAAN